MSSKPSAIQRCYSRRDTILARMRQVREAILISKEQLAYSQLELEYIDNEISILESEDHEAKGGTRMHRDLETLATTSTIVSSKPTM